MFRISAIIVYLVAVFISFMVHLTSESLNGQEIGFLEDYVLAEDREAALRQLVPGTEDYYFYHCLHYQNSRKFDRVNAMTVAWKKRFGETTLYQRIVNRQMMLRYSNQPQETLKYVKEKLNLNFNHQRNIPQAEQKLPTALDPDQITPDRLLKDALSRGGLEKITDEGLYLVANANLKKTQRRQLLTRLNQPNFPNLVDLIAIELQERDAAAFGKLKIHQALTIDQLEQLAAKRPRLRSETDFVNIYMSKLVPGDHVNWVSDVGRTSQVSGAIVGVCRTAATFVQFAESERVVPAIAVGRSRGKVRSPKVHDLLEVAEERFLRQSGFHSQRSITKPDRSVGQQLLRSNHVATDR